MRLALPNRASESPKGMSSIMCCSVAKSCCYVYVLAAVMLLSCEPARKQVQGSISHTSVGRLEKKGTEWIIHYRVDTHSMPDMPSDSGEATHTIAYAVIVPSKDRFTVTVSENKSGYELLLNNDYNSLRSSGSDRTLFYSLDGQTVTSLEGALVDFSAIDLLDARREVVEKALQKLFIRAVAPGIENGESHIAY